MENERERSLSIEQKLNSYIEEKKQVSNAYAELVTECNLYKQQVDQYSLLEQQHRTVLDTVQEYQLKYSKLYQEYKKYKNYFNENDPVMKSLRSQEGNYNDMIQSIIIVIIICYLLYIWIELQTENSKLKQQLQKLEEENNTIADDKRNVDNECQELRNRLSDTERKRDTFIEKYDQLRKQLSNMIRSPK